MLLSYESAENGTIINAIESSMKSWKEQFEQAITVGYVQLNNNNKKEILKMTVTQSNNSSTTIVSVLLSQLQRGNGNHQNKNKLPRAYAI